MERTLAVLKGATPAQAQAKYPGTPSPGEVAGGSLGGSGAHPPRRRPSRSAARPPARPTTRPRPKARKPTGCSSTTCSGTDVGSVRTYMTLAFGATACAGAAGRRPGRRSRSACDGPGAVGDHDGGTGAGTPLRRPAQTTEAPATSAPEEAPAGPGPAVAGLDARGRHRATAPRRRRRRRPPKAREGPRRSRAPRTRRRRPRR